MKCWSVGELRAFIDRELTPDEMAQVGAHLEECSECGDLWAELAGRASRVSALMGELAEAGPAGRVVRMKPRPAARWRWAGAAAAVAAGLLVGVAVLPKRNVPVTPTVEPRVMAPVARTAAPPETTPVAEAPPVVSLATATTKPPVRRNRKPAVAGKAALGDTFLALDNDPIEAGVVVRVALGPREVPADVILDADGRPRAIRLVDFKPSH